MIYFIRGTISGSIKIGYTGKDPGRRLAQLQTGSPERLELLGSIPGGLEDEARLHARFAAYRLRADGEWFSPSDTMMAEIRVILRPVGPSLVVTDHLKSREHRLLAALGFAERHSLRKLSVLVAGLEDHEGSLEVSWKVIPTEDEKQLFRDAWDFLDEDGSNVSHVFVGGDGASRGSLDDDDDRQVITRHPWDGVHNAHPH